MVNCVRKFEGYWTEDVPVFRFPKLKITYQSDIAFRVLEGSVRDIESLLTSIIPPAF